MRLFTVRGRIVVLWKKKLFTLRTSYLLKQTKHEDSTTTSLITILEN